MDATAASQLDGMPPPLREQLEDMARETITSWHQEALEQLGALLAAEQACPDAALWLPLRKQLLAGGLAAAAAAAAPAGAGGASKAARVQSGSAVLPRADKQYLMGWLQKLSRKGIWQKR